MKTYLTTPWKRQVQPIGITHLSPLSNHNEQTAKTVYLRGPALSNYGNRQILNLFHSSVLRFPSLSLLPTPPQPIPITLRFPPPTFCPSLLTLANTPESPFRFPYHFKAPSPCFHPQPSVSQTLPLEQEILLRKYDHVCLCEWRGRKRWDEERGGGTSTGFLFGQCL